LGRSRARLHLRHDRQRASLPTGRSTLREALSRSLFLHDKRLPFSRRLMSPPPSFGLLFKESLRVVRDATPSDEEVPNLVPLTVDSFVLLNDARPLSPPLLTRFVKISLLRATMLSFARTPVPRSHVYFPTIRVPSFLVVSPFRLKESSIFPPVGKEAMDLQRRTWDFPNFGSDAI